MRRNLNTAVISTLLVALLVGCPKRVGSSELAPESREKVEAARRETEAGRPDDAMKLLQAVPEQNDAVADALFAASEAEFQARHFPAARDGYRDLLARFPLFKRADTAKYHLGLAHLELREYRDALQTLAPIYPRVPESERRSAATNLVRAAEGAHAWGEAVAWNLKLADLASDDASRQQALKAATDDLDRGVSFTEIARLAQETSTDSPLWPALQFKLAKVLAHLRDQPRLIEALQTLLAKAPNSPYSTEARAMLERAERKIALKTDTVGLVLPLSGKYKAYGETVLAGIRLALQGSKVNVVTRDTAGDPAVARRAVAELSEQEGVIAIIGPVLSAESEDGVAEAEMQSVPTITLTFAEGITKAGPHIFRNMLTNSAQARALVDYAMRVNGLKRFALLYPNIPYGTELANLFWDEVEAHDGEIRAVETYEADQTTFGPTIKRMVARQTPENSEEYLARKREILETIKDPFRQKKALEDARKRVPPVIDFDAIFIPDYFKNVGLVAPALAVEDVITNLCDPADVQRIARTTGRKPDQIKTVQLLGGNGWNFNELVDRGGKFVQCSVFVDGFFVNSERPHTKQFVDEYRKVNGKDPTLLSASGYDTARIVRQIIESEKPTSREAFREGLLRIKDFPGVTGATRFKENGEVEKPLFFLTIDTGGIREVDSAAPKS